MTRKDLHKLVQSRGVQISYDHLVTVASVIERANETGLPTSHRPNYSHMCSKTDWEIISNNLKLPQIPGQRRMYVITREEGVFISSVPNDHVEFDNHAMHVASPRHDMVIANTLRNILVQAGVDTIMEHEA